VVAENQLDLASVCPKFPSAAFRIMMYGTKLGAEKRAVRMSVFTKPWNDYAIPLILNDHCGRFGEFELPGLPGRIAEEHFE
jgi:hypothetical protein